MTTHPAAVLVRDDLVLPVGPEAAALAVAFVERSLVEWCVPMSVIADVAVVTRELVGNAAYHGGREVPLHPVVEPSGPVLLRLALVGNRFGHAVQVAVRDHGPISQRLADAVIDAPGRLLRAVVASRSAAVSRDVAPPHDATRSRGCGLLRVAAVASRVEVLPHERGKTVSAVVPVPPVDEPVEVYGVVA